MSETAHPHSHRRRTSAPRGNEQVAGAGDRLHGPVHGRARRHRREHRAALGAARPALLARQPPVDRQRLHARVRRLPAARRPRRRPARAQAAVRGRRAAVLGRLAAQRLRAVLRDADRRPRRCRASAARSSPPPPCRSSPPPSPTPSERTKALGVWSAIAAGGAAVGLLMGGVLTDIASWRWVFFVNVPVGIITIAMALRYVAESRIEVEHRSFDLAGAVTVTGGLVVLVYAIVKAQSYGWGSARTHRAAGRRGRAAGGLHGDRGPQQGAADAAEHLPGPRAGRGRHRAAARGLGHVRDVLLRLALRPGDPRLQPAARRAWPSCR